MSIRKFFRLLLTSLKWLVLAAVAVEVFAFLIVSASNYLIYGHLREGSRVRYDPYTLFLGAAGPRPTAHNPPAAAPGKVIWMLGGSTLRGASDHDDRTIPSFLARRLNRPGGPPVTVVNFGENSFNSLIETKYLQKLLIEHGNSPPDLVIFYDGANDCSYFAQYRTPYGHFGYRRVRALVESYYRSLVGLLKPLNAAIYSSFTKELYDKLRQTAVPLTPDSEILKNLAAVTEQRYEHVRRLARCYGADFLLFWQPLLWVETAPVAPEVKAQERGLTVLGDRFLSVRHNFTVTYEALARRLQEKPYFVNFRNVLCPRTEPVYKPDGVHLLDPGHELVAGEMARVLEKRWPGK
jgi:lysophospholipase L1-like esterase